jgi:hypothetical protein
MTEFILHAGPHKTGTSYLQEAFAATRPLLAERGVLYPTTWGMRAHHLLHDMLQTIPNRLLEDQFAEMRASGQPVVLISVEGLTTLPAATVAYLRTLIGPGNTVRVVFYARSWADILPSHWKQAIKAGDTQTLVEYLYARGINPRGSFFVNFGTGLRHYATVFGAHAISIVSYDTVLAAKLDLFEHFAATFLDWRDPPRLDLGGVNVSPGLLDTEILRALNSIERSRRGTPLGRGEAVAMADRYLLHAPQLVTPLLRQAMAANVGKALVNEGSNLLTSLHMQLFNEFGRALVQPHPPGVFFAPKRAELPYVHRDYMLCPGVVDELWDTHRKLVVRPAPMVELSAA